jgi:hypothetical protein
MRPPRPYGEAAPDRRPADITPHARHAPVRTTRAEEVLSPGEVMEVMRETAHRFHGLG